MRSGVSSSSYKCISPIGLGSPRPWPHISFTTPLQPYLRTVTLGVGASAQECGRCGRDRGTQTFIAEHCLLGASSGLLDCSQRSSLRQSHFQPGDHILSPDI